MQRILASLFYTLLLLAAFSINTSAQTVDPTRPGLRIKGNPKTETGVDISDGVCRVTFFAMDGLTRALRTEVSCWKDRATYDKWLLKEADSQPIRTFEFTANGENYVALLTANASLFSNFIDKIEKVLLQDPNLSEKLRNNRTP